jgi:hypothetical protein
MNLNSRCRRQPRSESWLGVQIAKLRLDLVKRRLKLGAITSVAGSLETRSQECSRKQQRLLMLVGLALFSRELMASAQLAFSFRRTNLIFD